MYRLLGVPIAGGGVAPGQGVGIQAYTELSHVGRSVLT
jgi:hypothetical protein